MWLWVGVFSAAGICSDIADIVEGSSASELPSTEREHHRVSAAPSCVVLSSPVPHQDLEFLSTRQERSS